MLCEWYFCNCIGLSPFRTAQFLSAITAIAREDEPELLGLALQQIQVSSIWEQIYAFPVVLRRQRQGDVPEQTQAAVESYLSRILELLPSDYDEVVDTLATLVASFGEQATRLQNLEKVAVVFARRDRLTPSDTPYLDLERFISETVLLSLLYEEARTQRSTDYIAAQFRKSNLPSLEGILEEAVEGNLGRLAFRLASALAPSLLEGMTTDLVRDRLLSLENSLLMLEPDLLHTLIQVVFVKGVTDEQSAQRSAQQMLDESQTLRYFLRWLSPMDLVLDESQQNIQRRLFERFGRVEVASQQQILPVIIWQLLLWQAAAELDPLLAHETLSGLWQIPTTPASSLDIHSTLNDDELSRWKSYITVLLRMQDVQQVSIAVDNRKSHASTVSGSAVWAVYSPWLRIQSKHLNDLRRPGDRYRNSTNRASILRLVGASYTAAYLVQTLGNSVSERRAMLDLLLHCKNVIDTCFGNNVRHEGQLQNIETKRNIPYFSNFYTQFGLLAFCLSQVDHIGQLHVEAVSPEDFLEALHPDSPPTPASSKSDRFLFQQIVALEAIVAWVEDAYAEAVGESHAQRWLLWLGQINSYVDEAGSSLRERTQKIAAMLYRYIKQERVYRSTELNQIDISRDALLLGHISIEEWLASHWGRTLTPADMEQDAVQLSLQIAIAGQRLQSLRSDVTFTDASLRRETELLWIGQWQDALASAHEAREMDRFSRLQLLELLDHPSLFSSEEAQTLIAHSILEFGSLFDIDRLFLQLFWNEPQSSSLSPVSSVRQAVRLRVLQSILELARSTSSESGTSAGNSFLRKRKQNRVRHRYLQEAVTRILLAAQQGRLGEDSKPLLSELHDQYVGVLQGKLHRTRRIAAEVRQTGATRKVFILPDEATQGRPDGEWALTGAFVDPNNLTAELYYDVPRATDCLFPSNTLKSQLEEIIDDLAADTASVLAIQVAYESRRNGHNYIFACGLPHYLTHESDIKLDSDTRFFRLELSGQQQDRYVAWSLRHAPTPVYGWQLPGDVDNGVVREMVVDHVGMPHVYTSYDIRLGPDDVDLSKWDADISRRFAPVFSDARAASSLVDEYWPWMILDSEKRWIPFEHDLTGLLTIGNHFGSEGAAIYVLTLVSPYRYDPDTGESVWIWSTRPGENYRLTREDFSNESLMELDKALSEKEPEMQVGLLIAVRAVLNAEDSVCLTLVQESGRELETQVSRYYPEMEAAIDYRNWRWRDLFDNWADVVANRDPENKEWFIEIPDGTLPRIFPNRISVELKAPPRITKTPISVSDQSWEIACRKYSRSPKVTAIQDNFELRLRQNEQAAFLEKWLTPSKGDRFFVTDVRNGMVPGTEGRVWCRTEEGADISIEAESLALIWSSTRPHLPTSREVEVTGILDWIDVGSPVRVELPSELFSEADGYAEGVLTALPQDSTVTVCTVLWKTVGGPQAIPINVSTLPQLRSSKLRVGARILGRQTEQGPKIVFQTRTLFGRALWELSTDPPDNLQGMVYVGKVDIDSSIKVMVCDASGRLYALADDYPNALHGARFNSAPKPRLEGGLNVQQSVTYQKSAKKPWRSETGYRVVLNQNGRFVSGFSKTLPQESNLRVTDCLLSIERRDEDKAFLIRKFELAQSSIEKTGRGVKPPVSKDYQGIFNEYLVNPHNLTATIHDHRVELHDLDVPSDPAMSKWTRSIPRVDSETTLVLDAKYGSIGFVRLRTLRDGVFSASIRDVPPYTLEAYREELDFPPVRTTVALSEPLLYAGTATDDNPLTDTTLHRFEWGYGKVLEVPHTCLRIDGQTFTREEGLLLAYGDSVSQIEFLQEAGRESDQTVLIMNLRDVSPGWSQGHRLYSQRSQMRIVHLLHLRFAGGALSVESIEAFNEESIEMVASISFARVRSYTRLSDSSNERLLGRCIADDMPEGRTFAINGRLDAQKYVETLGREIVFDHVHLGFDVGPNGGMPIARGEVIFVDASSVEQLGNGNEYGLGVSVRTLLEPKDYDEGFADMFLLRRNFAERVGIMERAMEQEKRHEFQGRILVRVSGYNDVRPIISLDDMPPRRRRALIRGRGDSVAYATWVKTISDRHGIRRIVLEVKPGVLVSLEADSVDCPENVNRGTVVRAEALPGGRTRLVIASFSDLDYIPEEGRIAVALPKNDLFRKDRLRSGKNYQDQKFWVGGRMFTVGGLPNIEACLGHHHQVNGWIFGNSRLGIELMGRPHPKMVYLGQRDDQVMVDPDYSRQSVGHLRLSGHNLNINAELDDEEELRLVWRYQSFADRSARSLRDRINRVTWVYHDKVTVHWPKDQDQAKLTKIRPHSATRGPVVFEITKIGGFWEHCMRYSPEKLLSFGYPSGELASYLHSTKPDKWKRHRDNFAVATVSKRDSVWLEIAPGRVVEVSTQLFVRKSLSSEEPIAHFAWPLFSTGDTLQLSLSRRSLLEIDRFVIEDWRHGLRGVLGSRRAFLPVADFDSEEGALHLGEGRFQMVLPVETRPDADLVVLLPDNDFEVGQAQLERNDVILLKVTERGRFTAIGFPDYIPLLDSRIDWSNYPFDYEHGDERNRSQHIAAVIEAIGGVLPVTVENVLHDKKLIFFSLRMQTRIKMAANQVVLAEILGMARNGQGHVVLMRAGCQFLWVYAKELVSGLPEQHASAAVDQIVRSGKRVWLRTDSDGALHCGFGEPQRETNFEVQGRDVVVDDEGEPSGLICEGTSNSRLYWLPANRLAWTSLSIRQIEQAFIRTQEPFEVALWNDKQVSIRDLRPVRELRNRLRLGDTIQVSVPEKIGIDPDRPLVSYSQFHVLLAYEPDPEMTLTPGQELAVEVVQINDSRGQLDVRTVQLGKRRYQLALPNWMASGDDGANPHLDVRQRIELYRAWQLHERNLDDFRIADLLRGDYDGELDSLLCYGYEETIQGRFDEAHLQVALRWSKLAVLNEELDAALAIMAILVLDKYSQLHPTDLHKIAPNTTVNFRNAQNLWRTRICELVENIGRRALVSQHVEILATKWLLAYGERQARNLTTGEWKRFDGLRSHMKRDASLEDLIQLRRYFAQAAFRSADKALVAKALARAAGLPIAFGPNEADKCIVSNRLIDIYRCSVAVGQNRLHIIHIKQLSALLEDMQSGRVDNIVLLQPLPVLGS